MMIKKIETRYNTLVERYQIALATFCQVRQKQDFLNEVGTEIQKQENLLAMMIVTQELDDINTKIQSLVIELKAYDNLLIVYYN